MGAYDTNGGGGDREMPNRVLWENTKKRDKLEDLSVNGRILLK
jgi:hypothetical protein